MKEFKGSQFPRCPGGKINNDVNLFPGEYHFAIEPTIIHTVLGSCVSVVLFDRVSRYGAMCHGVLDSNPGRKDAVECFKYLDCVIDEMFSNFLEYRISPQRVEAKIFGGAKMLDHGMFASSISQPGEKNIYMARKMLQEYGCQIEADDCGGLQGRKIFFCSHTGDVFLKRIKKTFFSKG